MNIDRQINCRSGIAIGEGFAFNPNVPVCDCDYPEEDSKADSIFSVMSSSGTIAGSVSMSLSCAERRSGKALSLRWQASSRETFLPKRWYFKGARTRFEVSGNHLRSIGSAGTILYIGGFVLPDGNAAAHRVIANARIFAELGYDVAFLSYSDKITEPRVVDRLGFCCFEYPGAEWRTASRLDIDRVVEVVECFGNVTHIIAYNYPAPALSKLVKYCKSHDLLCIGDVTEWYSARDVSLPKAPAKFVDTFWRMRFLNKKLDGVIAISDYLVDFYKGCVPTINLPPLVDASQEKWAGKKAVGGGAIQITYAGKPSRRKERLDLIVKAILSQDPSTDILLNVVGIDLSEFRSVYRSNFQGDERVRFHGRVSHERALQLVKQSDYTIIVRDDNKVTRAGFPTKFAESVTCGVPVICNSNSDLEKWVVDCGCGVLTSKRGLAESIREAARQKKAIKDRGAFDYRRFTASVKEFMSTINEGKKDRA